MTVHNGKCSVNKELFLKKLTFVQNLFLMASIKAIL